MKNIRNIHSRKNYNSGKKYISLYLLIGISLKYRTLSFPIRASKIIRTIFPSSMKNKLGKFDYIFNLLLIRVIPQNGTIWGGAFLKNWCSIWAWEITNFLLIFPFTFCFLDWMNLKWYCFAPDLFFFKRKLSTKPFNWA